MFILRCKRKEHERDWQITTNISKNSSIPFGECEKKTGLQFNYDGSIYWFKIRFDSRGMNMNILRGRVKLDQKVI
jgi:hypothetical protein